MKYSTLLIKYITVVFFIKLYIICARAVYQADYIIVGAGTAGSVLANRLSEPPHITVLVLEAGDVAPVNSEVPLYPLNLALTNYSWQFKSVPSKTIAQGLKNRQLLTVEGKALGGTTVLNYNLFVRGNRRDYDNWARHGAIGWDWKSVYPYFLKLENNREYCNVYHGVGGNVIVQTPPFHAPITKGYLEAAIEIGYTLGDFNAKNQTVFQPPQGTVNRGARWSAVKAYINPARGRRNLWILTSAFVHKILIRIYIILLLYDYTPAIYLLQLAQEQQDHWQFKSVPSKTIAQGLKNRQLLTVEGKALGGTTVLNYNLFVRGNRRDYDNWARHGAI
ncbi:glucose dehydrogenase [FAD, quinone]-like, partial [Centruroides sculpturatus]|uniref:glucose dehydrogenase [FAD, quinone]-like n=1 Tax=Centruroides sculpturatus TaxID=218467 RepID=UPI000C6D992E